MAPNSSAVLENLHANISGVFDQAQMSLANHKKNSVALYKLHVQAAKVSQAAKKGTATKLLGERAFGNVFIDMVNRVLLVKKGPVTADRIVKFVGSYVKFLNEKVASEKVQTASTSSISVTIPEEDEDTFASRFVSHLLNWLFQGFVAKSKNVRYRSVFIVSEMISHLGEIDEDTYDVLRESLMDRICDKESPIRAHAVTALSKLVGSEDPDEVASGEKTILEVLLDVICTDPAAEVRRAALLSVPIVANTLDVVLSRTRDTDPVTRKHVYASVLQSKLGHPRQLTIAQREKVVKDGLGDREPGVRVAAGKLVTSWFDMVLGETKGSEGQELSWTGDDAGIMRGMTAFLLLFDVVGPGEAVAVDAVLSIFVTRPEIPDVFVFSAEFWRDLSPESVVLARVLVDHYTGTKQEDRLEAASLPVVTAFAFHIQEAYNSLLEVLQEEENARMLGAPQDDEDEDEELEEEMAKREVILGELLKIALKLDYMDEIGRRKVFSVVRDMLAHPELPPGLIERCLDILKEIMPSERDLIRVVVEIVIELRDGDEENNNELIVLPDDTQSDITQTTFRRDRSIRRTKEHHQMSTEERMQADIMDIRCLMLCIAMLERVDGSFEDNSTLEGILADLIIPSVKRKELAMREKALISLGLCCLIAKNMALSSFQLFVSQVQSAPDDLKVQVLRIILDLLFMYDHALFGRSEDIAARIITFLLQTLEAEESHAAQAVLCTGICKLLLAGIITDPRVLTSLALAYVSPLTAENQEVRQCLSYFFPVYCYSSSVNQSRMQSIFVTAVDLFIRMYEEKDEDQEMITPQQFGLLMVDWTNPQKASDVHRAGTPSRDVHVDLAVDILVALYESDRSDEEQKVLCHLLDHLNIISGLDPRSIHKLNILLTHHEKQCPFENSAVTKLFDRFKTRFLRFFAKEIKQINPQKYLDVEFQELYEQIAVDMPDAGEDNPSFYPENRDETSENDATNASDVDGNGTSSAASPGTEAAPPLAKDSRPKKRGKTKSKQVPQAPKELSEEEEEDSLDTPASPTPLPEVTPGKKGVKRVHTPGSASVSSPPNRKKNRIKSPRRTRQAQVSGTEDEGATTPTKSERRGTRQGGRILVVVEDDPTSSSDEDHAPLENLRRHVPDSEEPNNLSASSDDLAGYSD